MIYVVTLVHVLVCFFLIIVVLLQSGKAADLAGAFGGMGSQTAFGPRGAATVLSKATTIAAALFMLTSLTLAIMATRSGQSTGSTVLEKAPPVKSSAPAQSPINVQTPAGGVQVAIPPEAPPAGAPAAPAQQPPAAPAKK